MTTLNISFDEQDRFRIVETTRILLAAGSRTDGPVDREPLDHITKIMFRVTGYGYLTQVRMLSNRYLLIAELFQLLVTHGAMVKTELYFPLILYMAGTMANNFNRETDVLVNLESHNSIIDSCADMLHCLFFTGKRIKNHKCIAIESFYDDNAHTIQVPWSCLFTSIAQYSSLPGRSNKLIQLILNNLMTTTDLNDLKIFLSRKVIFCTESKLYDELASTVIALERIRTQELPFRLEHLACRALTDAMEGRSLSSISTLGLPACMEKCVVPNQLN